MSTYKQLPTKFDYRSYYLNQSAGGPSFPIYRARQQGGLSFGFLAPLLRRHGVPLLKWLGGQAATLASGLGNTYLQEGKLTKDAVKQQLKSQGKAAANTALDKLKQQFGSGLLRRDARLSALIPMRSGNNLLTSESRSVGNNLFPVGRAKRRKRSKVKKTAKRSSKRGKRASNRKRTRVQKKRPKKAGKQQLPPHTIFT